MLIIIGFVLLVFAVNAFLGKKVTTTSLLATAITIVLTYVAFKIAVGILKVALIIAILLGTIAAFVFVIRKVLNPAATA